MEPGRDFLNRPWMDIPWLVDSDDDNANTGMKEQSNAFSMLQNYPYCSTIMPCGVSLMQEILCETEVIGTCRCGVHKMRKVV
jgi:hypothetical protein